MKQLQRHLDNSSGSGKRTIPSVAVVILNWNGRAFLEQFLPSVIASRYDNLQVIIADNASTDESVAFVQANYPSIRVIQNDTNGGFAKGYNLALAQVKGDYYVLLNSDVEVTPDWIRPVIALMERNPLIAACQPKLLSYADKGRFEYAGASGGWLDKFGYPFMRGRVFDVCETDEGQYDTATACFWASGAALFVRSAVYHEMGGLDEYFFAHQEEIDLCWRMQLAGYTIMVEPASVVYHVGGGTLPKGNSRKAFLNYRNNLIMISKNTKWGGKLWKIPVRLMLDGLAAWRSLFAGDPGGFAAVVKAHVHYVGWCLGSKRRNIFPRKKGGRLNGLYPGSVVWAYFIQKKRTFSKIVGHN